MTDVYLQELMHGNDKKQKNRFLNEIDREIDKVLTLNQDNLHELETSKLHKERLKLEMKKELEFPEIACYIKSALDELCDSNELDPLEKENIIMDLAEARELIDELNEKMDLKDNLKELFEISDESIESIFKLALNKLDANELESSLALFTFLVVLIPENADYCYRAGIIAQMCDHIDFALKMYSASLIGNPDLIEAKILSLDCYIKLGNKAKSLELSNELNEYISSNVVDNRLREMFIGVTTCIV